MYSFIHQYVLQYSVVQQPLQVQLVPDMLRLCHLYQTDYIYRMSHLQLQILYCLRIEKITLTCSRQATVLLIYAGVCVCMYVCACVRVRACACVRACDYVCLQVCLYASLHLCLYICMYVLAIICLSTTNMYVYFFTL